MSGGYFDYEDYRVDEIASKLEELIINNNSEELTDWGTTVGRKYNKKTIAEFSVALDALRRAAVYLHRIDWLVSCDDGEEDFHTRLKEDLMESRYVARASELLRIFDGESPPTSGALFGARL